MEDNPIAAHSFGSGLAVDLLAILSCGKVPESVEEACPIERFLVVNLAILRSLFDMIQSVGMILFEYQPMPALFRAFTINALFFL